MQLHQGVSQDFSQDYILEGLVRAGDLLLGWFAHGKQGDTGRGPPFFTLMSYSWCP